MPAVKYRAERTCCNGDRPVTMQTADPTHFDKSTGVWVRCQACGHVHWTNRHGMTNE